MMGYEAVEVFRALGDSMRLRIIQMLLENNVVHCTTLEQELQIGKSTISYHIKILRSAGLINVHKDGRFYHYTLRRPGIDEFMPDLLKLIAHLPRQVPPQPALSELVLANDNVSDVVAEAEHKLPIANESGAA